MTKGVIRRRDNQEWKSFFSGQVDLESIQKGTRDCYPRKNTISRKLQSYDHHPSLIFLDRRATSPETQVANG
ncbi:MAG: hypothetical protein N2C14_24660, partial [Planctomycetales bacterium]